VTPRSLVLGLAFVLAACTSGGTATTVTTTAPSSSSTTAASTSSSVDTSSTTVVTVPEDTTLPPGTETLPLAMRQDIAGLIGVTEDLRGLQFLEPPAVTVVSDAELADRVRASVEEDTTDVPSDQALLRLLGLIGPDVDLLGLYTDLYGEQVAGFYDGSTGELVVPASSDGFTPLERATLVHELTHALTDQRFGFHDAYEGLIDGDRFDRAVAMLAVVEGDATLTQIRYIGALPPDQQKQFLDEAAQADSAAFDAAPPFLQQSLTFPYQSGLAFVQRLFGSGGYDQVNRAYVEPPDSSEQIIHPRDYQTDEPMPVETYQPTLDGYDVSYRSTWGELGFELMFDQVLGDGGAASDGWGGDQYIQWFNGTDSAIVIDVRSDTVTDAAELESALLRFAATSMAVGEPVASGAGQALVGDDFAFVARAEDRVVFVAAGDPAVGRRIADSVRGL